MVVKSIRWHIQLWHTAILIIAVSCLLFWVYYKEKQLFQRNAELKLSIFATQTIPYLYDQDFQPVNDFNVATNMKISPQSYIRAKELDGYYFIRVSPDNHIFYQSDAAPSLHNRLETSARHHWVQGNLEYRYTFANGAKIFIGMTREHLTYQTNKLIVNLTLIGTFVVGLGLIGGWLMSGVSIKPLRKIALTASNIAEGKTYERINLRQTKTELGELAQTLNSSFDKLSSLAERQTRFTADASHDLRTPVTILLAKCQLALLKDRSQTEYKETIESCLSTAEHMQGLIEALMELAEHDSGQLRLHKEIIDLEDCIKETIELLHPLFQEKKIPVKYTGSCCEISADPIRIKQVLINVITNAIKHTETGAINITLEQKENNVLVSIQDTGEGIQHEDISKIFNRFYKADMARSISTSSHGLGLAISQNIMEAHGGTIKVESQLGVGSTFSLAIPINLAKCDSQNIQI